MPDFVSPLTYLLEFGALEKKRVEAGTLTTGYYQQTWTC
jgi:hypothetical protein